MKHNPLFLIPLLIVSACKSNIKTESVYSADSGLSITVINKTILSPSFDTIVVRDSQTVATIISELKNLKIFNEVPQVNASFGFYEVKISQKGVKDINLKIIYTIPRSAN